MYLLGPMSRFETKWKQELREYQPPHLFENSNFFYLSDRNNITFENKHWEDKKKCVYIYGTA